jgi:tetratricopeptide (TPR) repeat protein
MIPALRRGWLLALFITWPAHAGPPPDIGSTAAVAPGGEPWAMDEASASIAQLKALILANPEAAETPGWLLQLAALYAGAADTAVENAHEWRSKAIKVLESLLARYPDFTQADTALYLLGETLTRDDQSEAGTNRFVQVLKSWPDSRHVPDAYIGIGDYLFDSKQYFKALLAFHRAATFGEQPRWAYAEYKLGWCYYNVGEFGKAIDALKAVELAARDGHVPPSDDLRDVARTDLMRFFADAGELAAGEAWFVSIGHPELGREMAVRLAETYDAMGRLELAAAMYRRLLVAHPLAPQAPTWQCGISRIVARTGPPEQWAREVFQMDAYQRTSAWQAANTPEAGAVARKLRRVELKALVVGLRDQPGARELRVEARRRLRGR